MFLQENYIHFVDDKFDGDLIIVISYLRRQQNLIEDMRFKCSKVSETHWKCIKTVREWFKLHMIVVNEYFEQKKSESMPSPA